MTSGGVIRQSEVEAKAEEAFGFLRDTGCDTEVVRRSTYTVLSYVLPELLVEVELDFRESGVFVLVGEPVDGSQRRYLGDVLRGTEHQPRMREVVGKAGWGEQAMLDQLTACAAALRATLPDLPRLVRQAQAG